MRTRPDHRLYGALIRARRLRRFTKGEQGSFTLEASLAAPLLIFATMTLVVFALYVFGLVQLNQAAAERSERAAFTWADAGGKSGRGLYWRVGEGMMSWFGSLTGSGDRRIDLPAAGTGDGSGSGVTAKLYAAAERLPADITGYIGLADRVLFRKVEAHFERAFRLRAIDRFGTLPAADQAHKEAVIVEPAELIRLVDLTRTYTSVIRGRITPRQAKAVLQEPQREDGGAVSIRSERQASAYLRKVTGGTQRTYPMEQGKSRVVDALDAGGIAHQAFYTYTETQLLQDQAPKDLLLLQTGQVKGVIWHFFAPPGKSGPSANLRNQLERKGIVVVVHT
ncbi:hypothetical protein ACFFK0_19950 [Paenibacillus chartarius]|uniref:Pilus assembly protein n=1 Tax=Paenibacillus chartarius TaxID=747481 RepID=A0ABV6DQ41_9BACL